MSSCFPKAQASPNWPARALLICPITAGKNSNRKALEGPAGPTWGRGALLILFQRLIGIIALFLLPNQSRGWLSHLRAGAALKVLSPQRQVLLAVQKPPLAPFTPRWQGSPLTPED